MTDESYKPPIARTGAQILVDRVEDLWVYVQSLEEQLEKQAERMRAHTERIRQLHIIVRFQAERLQRLERHGGEMLPPHDPAWDTLTLEYQPDE